MLTDYVPFFSASAGAAAALIGLLFVAISLARDPIFGPDGDPVKEASVSSAFTALTNSFLLALVALLPDTDLGLVALVLAGGSVIQMTQLVSLVRRSPRAALPRQILLLFGSFVIYGFEGFFGAKLMANPHDGAALSTLAVDMLPLFGIALARAWALVSARQRISVLGGVVGAVRDRLAHRPDN